MMGMVFGVDFVVRLSNIVGTYVFENKSEYFKGFGNFKRM